jgi:hypothetical protein
MIINEYNYKGYQIEIHENPIYHDFEYVVKENNNVLFANKRFFMYQDDAENTAELEINLHEDKKGA